MAITPPTVARTRETVATSSSQVHTRRVSGLLKPQANLKIFSRSLCLIRGLPVTAVTTDSAPRIQGRTPRNPSFFCVIRGVDLYISVKDVKETLKAKPGTWRHNRFEWLLTARSRSTRSLAAVYVVCSIILSS